MIIGSNQDTIGAISPSVYQAIFVLSGGLGGSMRNSFYFCSLSANLKWQSWRSLRLSRFLVVWKKWFGLSLSCYSVRHDAISAKKITLSSPVGCPPLHKKLRLPRGVWRSAFRRSVKCCLFCANVLQLLRGSSNFCWVSRRWIQHQSALRLP